MIIIANRLSTIASSDTIMVLDNGSIIEQGSHHELIKMNGKYFNLWNKQTHII